jgi:hypothetical protein
VTASTVAQDIAPFERHAFPNGTECFFRPKGHQYWEEIKWNKREDRWGGSGRLTGVSTLVKPFDFNPEFLIRWAANTTLEATAQAFGGSELPADPHLIRLRIQELALDHESVRDTAADRGKAVHEQMVEALAAGDKVPDLDVLPPEQRGYGQAVMAWWLDHEPEVTHSEQVVYSEQHRFAGRLDLRCRVTRGPLKGAMVLPDFKTSGFIAAKMPVQVSGYDLGIVESGLGEAADCVQVVQLREDGTYLPIEVDVCHEDFLAALHIYRRSQQLTKEIKAVLNGGS